MAIHSRKIFLLCALNPMLKMVRFLVVYLADGVIFFAE